MAEITLTRSQIRAIAAIAADGEPADKGVIHLLSPPEGDLFDAQYVEVKLTDENGEPVGKPQIITWAGTPPNFTGEFPGSSE